MFLLLLLINAVCPFLIKAWITFRKKTKTFEQGCNNYKHIEKKGQSSNCEVIRWPVWQAWSQTLNQYRFRCNIDLNKSCLPLTQEETCRTTINLELYHNTKTSKVSKLEVFKTRPPAYEIVLGIIYMNWQS